MKELPKAYEPKQYEDGIYKRWEESGLFNPDVCVQKSVTKKSADPFTIVLPPPNVTGTLHMGHAAMLAIEDVLIRYHRMKGDKTLWVPGTDHAAVATESKVEKLLIEKGAKKPKEELGREKFLEHVKKFAQESHDTIVNQAKKMGASLDWSREAYTLDDERNVAVRTVFKKMYDDGLIYRGYRVINWSVKGQSTCSDDELVYVERPGKLYYFKYSKDFPITIATTRPETKLGDTAVAVHPDDKRYAKYVGKTYTVEVGAAKPLSIKIIADVGVEMDKGTGALGVTPAHSVIDFEMYTKQKAVGNDLGLIQVIGEDGKMTAAAGKNYAGLYVNKAREKFVEYLRAEGLLEKEEDTMQNVGTSDRFGDVVEPLPKTQWFVDVNKKFVLKKSEIKGVKSGAKVSLKELMQKAVKGGDIAILPDRFDKTYFHWIDNLRDWCISRQIWFGHQIPVWYRGSETYCGVDAPKSDGWKQDPDTLDTWFSSGLWTFSTLGWPDAKKWKTEKVFHPTAVLETGYDILFFWVARMILMTTYTLGQVPFKTVYLHGLVRDEQGRKMSKTLGNIIDPLDMIKDYGTDATRLSLLIGSSPGNDVKLSEEKIAGFRNFTNKLWNIARFVLMTIEKPKVDAKVPKAKTLADEWILSKLHSVIAETSTNLEKFNLSYAGEKLRDFTWGDLADWYLEIAKVEGDKSEILNYILNTILKLWHPYMPFVTETIWSEVYGEKTMLMVAEWPKSKKKIKESDRTKMFEMFVVPLVEKIRSERASKGIALSKKFNAIVDVSNIINLDKFSVADPDDNDLDAKVNFLKRNTNIIEGLARLGKLTVTVKNQIGGSIYIGRGLSLSIDLGDAVDVGKEKERLTKELAEVTKYIPSLEAKLNNKDFVGRAPAAVIEGEKKKLEDAKNKQIKLDEQLKILQKQVRKELGNLL